MNGWQNNNWQEGLSVVAKSSGDVTGDKIPDMVYLLGKTNKNSAFVENIVLTIVCGRSRKMTKIPLSQNAGYNPSLFLGDFTGQWGKQHPYPH